MSRDWSGNEEEREDGWKEGRNEAANAEKMRGRGSETQNGAFLIPCRIVACDGSWGSRYCFVLSESEE